MSYYRNQLEDWLKKLKVQADMVFDIGGASNPVEGRVAEWNVKKYIIFDNGLEVPKTEFRKIDLNYHYQWFGTEEKDLRQADKIFCLEVFEYIFDPVQALKNIYNLLKKGGTAYITFPFVYPHHNPVENDYLRYTQFGVSKLIAEAGFNYSMTICRADRTGKLMDFYRADGMKMSKNYPQHNVTGFIVEAVK